MSDDARADSVIELREAQFKDEWADRLNAEPVVTLNTADSEGGSTAETPPRPGGLLSRLFGRLTSRG
ncbi:MAG TPA: hypothetical protein VFS62_15535 [Chloroflexota bacterium]|jgi:hypothetical protein|nr:hypothetical protein [Chloroflexota bacterium]